MTRSTKGSEWFGSDSLTMGGFVFLMRLCAIECQRVLKPGGHVLCFIDWRMWPVLADAIESADLRRNGLIVWDKTWLGMGSCFRNQHELILHFTKGVGSPPLRRDVGNVIACKPVRRGIHPTQKPRELLETLISVTCPEGGTVLDPFYGSCSAGIAAVGMGRRFVGVERDRHYFDAGVERLRIVPAEAAA